jgi:hypothetical protein
MTALSKIKQAGFDVFLHGDGFKIKPSSKLTPTQREFLKLHKAEIISELKAKKLRKPETFISCGDCLNFKSHNAHGGGSGSCLVGVQPNGSCWWSETKHQCIEFDAKIEWQVLPEPKHDALMVVCYTPAGDAIQIEAMDEEHGEWLQRMNPRRECSNGLKPVKDFLAAAVDKIDAMYGQNIEDGWTPNNTQPTEVKPDSEAAARPEPLEGKVMPLEKTIREATQLLDEIESSSDGHWFKFDEIEERLQLAGNGWLNEELVEKGWNEHYEKDLAIDSNWVIFENPKTQKSEVFVSKEGALILAMRSGSEPSGVIRDKLVDRHCERSTWTIDDIKNLFTP